jgi:hypothetical protein
VPKKTAVVLNIEESRIIQSTPQLKSESGIMDEAKS